MRQMQTAARRKPEELAKRIDEAQGVEKAKLIESNYDRIMSALKGVY
ncbi:MAG: hypothetical protein ACLUKN_01540 [Bacilli bacterium]